MRALDGKNLRVFRIEDGGAPRTLRTHAERDVELRVRELVYAMRGKHVNLRNVAEGRTFPLRMLCRRIREARRVRGEQVEANYWLCKQIAPALDQYVDAVFNRRTADVSQQARNLRQLPAFQPRRITTHTTGDHPRAA